MVNGPLEVQPEIYTVKVFNMGRSIRVHLFTKITNSIRVLGETLEKNTIPSPAVDHCDHVPSGA